MNLPSRLYSIDVARGLAAFSVVVWHWQHFFYVAPGRLSESFDRQAQPFYRVLSPFYNCGGMAAISFFFMLSGFVFFWLYRNRIESGACSFRTFWLARFSRLYPLHLITLLLVLVLQMVYESLYSKYFVYYFNDSYHFFLNLIFGSYWGFENGYSFNAPIWSVSMEIGLYLIFFVMVLSRKSHFISVLLLVGFLIIGPELGLHMGRWTGPLENFMIGGLVFYVLSFYLSQPWRSRLTDISITALPVGIWLYLGTSSHFAYLVLIKYSLLSRAVFPLSIMGLVLLESVVALPFKRMKWVGDCTYSSYLLHFPLQLIAVILVAKFSISQTVFYSRWSFLAFFCVLIPLSLGAHHYCEKPLQKAVRSFGKRVLKS